MEVSAAVSHLQDPTFLRPPPRPQPRPGAPGLTARRWLQSASRAPAALLPRPGRGWQPASAGPARGAGRSQGRGPGVESAQSYAALVALLGAPSAAGSSPGTRLCRLRVREGYTFPLAPLVSSRAVAAEVSSRGNYADPSLGSSPRPSSPPPPLCWGAGVGPRQRGGSGSLKREVPGSRGAAGHQLTPPCDAILRPVTPRVPRARARAPPRRAPCSCRDPRACRPHPSPRSIPASAGR